MKSTEVLITAGPTWVAIDRARVISNIGSGETGLLLADRLARLGAKVTILLGPGGAKPRSKALKIKILRYRFFDQLRRLLRCSLKNNHYGAVIHSAAVSDYRPRKIYKKKIASGLKNLKIELVPAPKLINLLKNYCPDAVKVGFKFQPLASRSRLISEGRRLLSGAGLNMVVANTCANTGYRAYILDNTAKPRGPFTSKASMAAVLCRMIGREL